MENINIQDINHIEKTDVKEVGELFAALAKAQMEMEVANEDATNPFYKSSYADLAALVKASRPYLAKNGLCVTHKVVPNGTVDYLCTVLGHISGQSIESQMRIIPGKGDIQSIGKCITYLKRYGHAALTGVVSCNDSDDDDGESIMKEIRSEEHKKTAVISKERLEVLATELNKHPDILEGLFKKYDINKLSELPAAQFTQCLERIRTLKETKRKMANRENS